MAMLRRPKSGLPQRGGIFESDPLEGFKPNISLPATFPMIYDPVSSLPVSSENALIRKDRRPRSSQLSK